MKTTRFILMAIIATAGLAQSPEWRSADAVARAAIAASPAVRALDARIEAAREAARSAGALPNPMAMGGVQNLNADLSNDPIMTMYMVGASQTFIPRERRESLRDAAGARVAALEAERASLRAELERDARAVWIELASIDAQTGVIENVLGLGEATVASTRARYEAGGAIQADVIRAQLAQSELHHRLLALGGARRATAASLAAILGLAPGTSVPNLALEHAYGGLSAPRFAPDDDHPALAAVLARAAAREAEIALARSATRPEWSIESAWAFRSEMDDMVTLTGRVELPLRRSARIDPAIREAIAERNAALEEVEQRRRSLEEMGAIALAVFDEAIEQIRFHDEVLMPQARFAFDSTLAAYETGAAGFDALLGAQIMLVRLGTDTFEFLERALTARADLTALAAGARTIRVGSSRSAPATSSPSAPTGMESMQESRR
ncbi:MAG TPA: TolC family protein [Thermoanaerobaculia bacterium]|nr:TolC family protein [Thermoanaerobaculia bacterium]